MREEAQVTLRAHLALVYVRLYNAHQITPALHAIRLPQGKVKDNKKKKYLKE